MSEVTIDALMTKFVNHNKYWERDVLEPQLEEVFRSALVRLSGEVDLSKAILCIGTTAYGIEVPPGEDEFGGTFPDKPNNYDLKIVTPRLIITAGGNIEYDPLRIVPELTELLPRRRITQITILLEAGDKRSAGWVSTHEEVILHFENGKNLLFPNSEDELTPVGLSALKEAIQGIKEEALG